MKYELILQPQKKPTDVDYKKEYSLRRLEKMQFPTKDEQFKRRLKDGGARDVTSLKEKERGKDADRKEKDRERDRKERRDEKGDKYKEKDRDRRPTGWKWPRG